MEEHVDNEDRNTGKKAVENGWKCGRKQLKHWMKKWVKKWSREWSRRIGKKVVKILGDEKVGRVGKNWLKKW